MGTDKDWEKWGATDPYYGVFSSEQYRASKLSNERKEEFFRSGEDYVDSMFTKMNTLFNKDILPDRAMDFGCGVGRLTKPLAKRCKHIIGIDVSTSMLKEARSNCSECQNISFVISDDQLSILTEGFDLVHTHLVLQHIPWHRGHRIVEQLLNRVNKGGYIVLHFVYKYNVPYLLRFLVKLRYKIPVLNYLRNLCKGHYVTEPPMQMHAYDLGWILSKMHSLGYLNIHQELDSWGNGVFDVTTIYAQRESTTESDRQCLTDKRY